MLSRKPAAAPDTEPRRVGWACEWDTSELWQGCCCLWLFCWIPRDKWVEPVEPCCLLGQNLRGCQSLPTRNAEPAGSLQAQSRVSVSHCTVQLARALTCRATPHHRHLWQSWHPQCCTGVMLEVAGIYVCRWAIRTMRPSTTHDAQAMLSALCIMHKSAVFCYSVIITSFIMAHISQQLYLLQNHHSKMGNNAMLLFHPGLVGLGTQCNTAHLASGGRWMATCQWVLWKAQPRWLCLLKSIQKPQLQSVKSNKHANYFKTNFN